MTSERAYKRAHVPSAALAELERCAGAQFDPRLVRVFVKAIRNVPNQTLEPAGLAVQESTP